MALRDDSKTTPMRKATAKAVKTGEIKPKPLQEVQVTWVVSKTLKGGTLEEIAQERDSITSMLARSFDTVDVQGEDEEEVDLEDEEDEDEDEDVDFDEPPEGELDFG